jgi:hypothetical protein
MLQASAAAEIDPRRSTSTSSRSRSGSIAPVIPEWKSIYTKIRLEA